MECMHALAKWSSMLLTGSRMLAGCVSVEDPLRAGLLDLGCKNSVRAAVLGREFTDRG